MINSKSSNKLTNSDDCFSRIRCILKSNNYATIEKRESNLDEEHNLYHPNSQAKKPCSGYSPRRLNGKYYCKYQH